MLKTKSPLAALAGLGLAAALSFGSGSALAEGFGKLRVAIDPTYKPFTYKTDAGEPTGFDVDIAKALCAQIKADCRFVEQQWDAMIPGLLSKKYDMIVSSMSITEERKQSVGFSNKYYNTPSCVVTKASLNLDARPASAKGLTLGVLKGSTQENFSKGELAPKGAKIVGYDAQDQVYLDIASGRLDGTVADVIEVTEGFLKTDQGKGYACAGDRIPVEFDSYFGEGVGVAVRKNETKLRDALNKAIMAIRSDGQWQKIADAYVPGVDLWGQ